MFVEIDEADRLAAPLSIEAFHDLVEWWAGCTEPEISPPLVLGWDIHRFWPNARGFGIWRDLMLTYEPPCHIPGVHKPVTMEQYEAALVDQWQLYDRPKHWTDSLIVDVMHDERERGYEPCGDASDRTEAILNELAAKVGAKRARDQAEWDARSERRRQRLQLFFELDDAGYAKWLADGRPWRDAKKVERWSERRFHEHLGKTLRTGVPFPNQNIPAEIVDRLRREREQYEAAVLGPLPDHPELPINQAQALNDYWAHLPSGKMIYERTGELFSASSVDKHIGRVKDAMRTEGPGTLATTWLSQHRFVKSMGWAPGEPKIIEDKVLTIDGWIRSPGDKTFNRYVAPHIAHVEGDVSRWLDHIRTIYLGEADHIVRWLAHRVQRPGDKVNHALVLIGSQGIGKDTILKPAISAIGSNNFKQITANTFFNSEWNDYLQSVILRINEVHDLGGESRYGFYDATKDVITNPPETHRINTKHVPQYAAVNVCGVVMTSNHLDALYLAPDDRRHFVCVSTRTQDDFSPAYWDEINAWFENGGNEAIAHYLANLDLSAFNAKAPPPKTAAWHMVVAAGMAPESGDLSDVIESMGKPDALTLAMVRSRTPGDSQLRLLFEDAKLRRSIPKRLAECGYVAVTNPDARDSGGRWRTPGGKVQIYVRQELSESLRLAAARTLSANAASPPPMPLRQ
ncbi:DUF5906 domain-containing protein [Bradyrhizobium oligotrophicum]|uniref:primase-helicase family protein n=1 Tax=Bradyrhizobium oligotrophicum TaxID=44255 RepID=UPI003EBE9FEC